MPLRALLENKDFLAENLAETSRNCIFKCPNCESNLIPVIPQKNIIKHFRHKDGHTHGEPETPEHEEGKNRLREIAESLGFEATTEYRIGKHITDVFVKSPKPLAIEFQWSKCNSDEILDRNTTYTANGVTPLWILGSKFIDGERQTKIEDEIRKNQDLFYFKNEKYFVKRISHYNEFLISTQINKLATGKNGFSEKEARRICNAYLAGKMDWQERFTPELLPIQKVWRLAPPRCFHGEVDHNTDNYQVVEWDINGVETTKATIAVFTDKLQVGTITELLHAIKIGKPTLSIFTETLAETNYLENIKFLQQSPQFSYYGVNSEEYWFLIDYLLTKCKNATVALVKTEKDIMQAITRWLATMEA